MSEKERIVKLMYDWTEKSKTLFYEKHAADLADHLIANGIGDITAEKHRVDVAEEALRLAFDEWTCCDLCMFSVDCKTNRTDCKKAEISKIKQQAEAGKIVIVKEDK